MNAYSVVEQFEQRVAEFSGAPYAVAVESCTAAIFLSLMFCNVKDNWIQCPAKTYVSVPMQILHAGAKIMWTDEAWTGIYRLKPYPVFDGAKRFRKDMYEGGFHCLSFHVKKHLPIGRGGMILLNDNRAAEWLRRARYDGRRGYPHHNEPVEQMGWNLYMEPTAAARGLMLLDLIEPGLPDQIEDYRDLRNDPVFKCA